MTGISALAELYRQHQQPAGCHWGRVTSCIRVKICFIINSSRWVRSRRWFSTRPWRQSWVVLRPAQVSGHTGVPETRSECVFCWNCPTTSHLQLISELIRSNKNGVVFSFFWTVKPWQKWQTDCEGLICQRREKLAMHSRCSSVNGGEEKMKIKK